MEIVKPTGTQFEIIGTKIPNMLPEALINSYLKKYQFHGSWVMLLILLIFKFICTE